MDEVDLCLSAASLSPRHRISSFLELRRYWVAFSLVRFFWQRKRNERPAAATNLNNQKQNTTISEADFEAVI